MQVVVIREDATFVIYFDRKNWSGSFVKSANNSLTDLILRNDANGLRKVWIFKGLVLAMDVSGGSHFD